MKILIRIICIATICGVLGFSIMASATGRSNEPTIAVDDRGEMIIAKSVALVTSANVQESKNDNSIILDSNFQNSALATPLALKISNIQLFKFSEAGNMLLLGFALIMIAGLGRKVLHKN